MNDFHHSILRRVRLAQCVLLAGSVAAVPMATAAAYAQAAAPLRTVRVIDPADVSPLVMAAPFDANGPAAHRRVVTRAGDGATYIDIGYNTYRKGTLLAAAYAYTTDEFCFVPSGRAIMENVGERVEFVPDKMMWRPSGAVTRSMEAVEDTVTICAMSPARLDANSHRFTPEQVNKQIQLGRLAPYVHYQRMTSARLAKVAVAKSRGVVEREVFSRRKDGSARASITYTTMTRGAHLVTGSAGEQICWVGTGAVRITSNGSTLSAAARTFIYRPEGVNIQRLEAVQPTSLTCFQAPSAL